jgi:putative ABC transport system substrate-binding protein
MDIKTAFKVVTFTIATIVASLSLSAETPPPIPKTVVLTQITEHPSADAVREGIIAGLRDNGFEDGKTLNLIYEDAQGSNVTAMQIAKKFVSLKPDLMMPITTPSTQVLVKANEDFSYPIVFAAVTDPVAAGIVKSLEHPGGVITGATDAAPIKRQLEIFKKVLPNLKTLGILYNPGDNSSATPVKETQALAKEMGITLVEATAFKTADVPGAMQQLAGQKVDAVFVPLDNTVLSAMDSVLKISFEYKIPVLTSDSNSVSQGALASSGYTHFATGYAAGEIAARVLRGEKPADIPVAFSQDLNVYVNELSAKKLGIKIPPGILRTAKHM